MRRVGDSPAPVPEPRLALLDLNAPFSLGEELGLCPRFRDGITSLLPDLNDTLTQAEGPSDCDAASADEHLSSRRGAFPAPDLTLSLGCPSPPPLAQDPSAPLSLSEPYSPLRVAAEAWSAPRPERAGLGQTKHNNEDEGRAGQQHLLLASAPFAASFRKSMETMGMGGDGSEKHLSVVAEPPRDLVAVEGHGDSLGQPGSSSLREGTASKSSGCARYLRQKRRDWGVFKEYLQSLHPPVQVHSFAGEHVVDFMVSLDQFGRTKVHLPSCDHYGTSQPRPCQCPLRQAWGSLDSLIGRLRAAFEEEGLQGPNPFGDSTVKAHLKKVKGEQSQAKGPKATSAAHSRKRSRTCVEHHQSQGLTPSEAMLIMLLNSTASQGASFGSLPQMSLLDEDVRRKAARNATLRRYSHDF